MTKPVYISRGLKQPFYLDAGTVVQVIALEGEKCEVVTERGMLMTLNYSMDALMSMLEAAQEAYWMKQRETFSRPKPRSREDYAQAAVKDQQSAFAAAKCVHEARMNERLACMERVMANWAKMPVAEFVNWLRDSILELRRRSK